MYLRDQTPTGETPGAGRSSPLQQDCCHRKRPDTAPLSCGRAHPGLRRIFYRGSGRDNLMPPSRLRNHPA